MATRRVAVVPHTHWDREWYDPFQTFRMRLVETMDSLLDLLEADPSYSRFLLDGQMAVIDDYLEIRPENTERLRRLCASGRVAVGPWYILMDEFLVSAETIVRDLQRGMRVGAAFGGVAEVGYLPDMFGHVAQMPQILRLAGLEHAVVWRGVPSAITKSGFWWHAPDGSTVRAEYLLDGYGNGASLPDDAKAVVAKVRDHVEQFSSLLVGDVLFMNGSDHLPPQRFLGRVVAEANGLQDDFELVISSLREHLDRAPIEGLGEWTGELRSGFRANVLMGVASNHVDVKVAAARAEESIERRAEPLTAMFVAPQAWPTALLDVAWREVIRNAAHDSICACSVDDVVLAVLHRFAEARQVGDGLAQRALQHLGNSMRTGGYVVANTSARARAGIVEVVLLGDDVDESRIQVVGERTALPGELVFDSSTARTLLGMIQGPRLDDDAWIQAVNVEERDDEVLLTVKVGAFEQPDVRLDDARSLMTSLLQSRPGVTVRVRLEQPTIRRVLARSGEVPGLGWRRFSPTALGAPVTVSDAPVTLTNGLCTVAIDPALGTFSIDGIPGFGRLVDDGDLGDSYNYSPPGSQSVVDTPESVSVELIERGPVRATAVVTSTYTWPERVDPVWSTRTGEQRVEVTTTIQLAADERLVRVTTSFVNPSRDHRLRAHFPTGEPATESLAECAFGTVRRGLTAEGRPGEFGLPTFPSRRFVQAGRVTVVHRGLHEYELTEIADGHASGIAITLLRSTGMLSRLGMALRPMPAGPLTPVEGLQLVGARITAEYAVGLDVDDPYAASTDVLTPIELVAAAGGGSRDDEGAFLTVNGAELSSLQVVDGLVELRVFNPRPESTTVELPGRRGWEVDLRGLVRGAFEERFELRGFGIATLRLAPDR
jgi:mannosylglycerate hydrolase